MLLEGTAAALIFLAWRKASQRGVMTPERTEMYNDALEHLTDPEALRKLATIFDGFGCYVQATVCRKRADLRGASDEVKAQRKEILEKALKSVKVEAILAVAKQFEALTATGAAKACREHAEDVKAGRYPPPAEAVVTPPPAETPATEAPTEAAAPSAAELESEERAAQATVAKVDAKARKATRGAKAEHLNGGTPPAEIVVESTAAAAEGAST